MFGLGALPAPAAGPPDPRALFAANRVSGDHTGLSLAQQRPDGFDVLAVTVHSPADEAGVRGGDRIIAFDGRNMDDRSSVSATSI